MTRRHLPPAVISAALHQLDPAGWSSEGQLPALTAGERIHADATLRRIVASDPNCRSDPATPSSSSSSSRWLDGRAKVARTTSRVGRRRRRMLLGLAAAVVAAVLAASGLIWNRDVAYASWTPVPVALSPSDSATAVDVCLRSYDQTRADRGAPLIADRRGGWAYVLIPLADNTETSCIMPIDAVRAGTVLRGGQFFGGAGDHPPLRPSPRHLYRFVSGLGSTDEGSLAYTEGEVGRDVVGVTITTPRGVRVVASVANGRYAAWWPAGKLTPANPESGELSLYDLTLRDGTTIHETPR